MEATMRLIVCGGRGYNDEVTVFATLDRVYAKRRITLVIQGGAPGADALAKRWAAERRVECIEVQADWAAHGRAAGPIRNGQMLDMRPDGVVAFPGGRGTEDMCRKAAERGVTVWRPILAREAGEGRPTADNDVSGNSRREFRLRR